MIEDKKEEELRNLEAVEMSENGGNLTEVEISETEDKLKLHSPGTLGTSVQQTRMFIGKFEN